ncbi:MAG: efflux RND transporter periplasmic adaptor subunit [Planctomycetes bacterium]|nr:efflux RND transporter periplasmic adaptor subunit [Planctomycetota bacterium]
MSRRRAFLGLTTVAAVAAAAFLWLWIKRGRTPVDVMKVIAAAATALWVGTTPPDPDEKTETETIATEVAVHVGKIQRATLHGYVVGYGTVGPEPANGSRPAAIAHITSSVPGIIAEVKCVEGQRVEKGTRLFCLDSRAADVLVEKARQAVKFAEKNYERQQKLQQVEGTCQKLIQEAEQQLDAARSELAAAEVQRAFLTIDAPLAGVLVRVYAKRSDVVDTATVLAELIDLSRLVVTASIPTAELSLLKPGQKVNISADHAASAPPPGRAKVHTGTLAFISSQVDDKSDTVTVRVSVPADGGLRPGQFAKIRIVCKEHRDCLAVPEESIVIDVEGHSVISLVEGDRAIQKPVNVGLREGGLVEIEGEGLKVGMTIVTTGAYGLPKETKIRVIEQ